MSRKNRAHLDFLRQDFAQRGSMLAVAPTLINIGLGTSGLQKTTNNSYEIGHRPLLRGKYLEEPILLVENSKNDGDFVQQIFFVLRKTHPVKEYSFTARHGGGSTIVHCFDEEIVQKRVVVCLIDSDKLSPGHVDSATLKSLVRVSMLGSFIGDIFVTKCREIENHLPANLIQQHNICPDYKEFELLFKFTNKSDTEDSANPWLYFDIKDGISGKVFLSKAHASSTREWVRTAFSQPGGSFDDLNLPGFGPNIMRQFLDSGPAMRDFKTHMLSPYWGNVFGGVFEQMLWYFASDKRRSTI
ncbi:hypothetical protein [Rhizobium sp. PL01]|uniref:hypothetical protein n=1 Tax=Rhizobium sp. PL01 TaxID=3085631 RepID=UPI002980BEF3|nr:hypothetical protein [Rhizobium sp. PL01]MDW5316505.1 hypothetical protein [Rhizobium sp. PL01]